MQELSNRPVAASTAKKALLKALKEWEKGDAWALDNGKKVELLGTPSDRFFFFYIGRVGQRLYSLKWRIESRRSLDKAHVLCISGVLLVGRGMRESGVLSPVLTSVLEVRLDFQLVLNRRVPNLWKARQI